MSVSWFPCVSAVALGMALLSVNDAEAGRRRRSCCQPRPTCCQAASPCAAAAPCTGTGCAPATPAGTPAESYEAAPPPPTEPAAK